MEFALSKGESHMFFNILITIVLVVVPLVHLLGLLTAGHAVMTGRSPQGAIAWAMSLLAFPWIALPAYWIFSRNKFRGYVVARRAGDQEIHRLTVCMRPFAPDFQSPLQGDVRRFCVCEKLAKMPFTRANDAELLIDGEASFGATFDAIEAAQDYILVTFFIVRNDNLGSEFKSRLIRKARQGVRVYFLYDEIGSRKLPSSYFRELQAAGVRIEPFKPNRGRRNRFQLNFRNHRKIVVVDGRVAFVGGLNIGDEYMGRDRSIGHWRDTAVKVEGPAVLGVQLACLEDWNWATRDVLEVNWDSIPASGGDMKVLALPTGPADELDTCELFFINAIQSARKRLWITSPYFVPDRQVISALQLAALRGVDVRLMLPENPDYYFVYLAAFSFLEETESVGVKTYRYERGFMHHKVLLIDDEFAAVGTANFDNRSFRLSFEITMVFADRAFAAQVEEMLERDFKNCRLARAEDFTEGGRWFRTSVRLARLAAPLL